jgi:long-chain acyl-CoA synthetase
VRKYGSHSSYALLAKSPKPVMNLPEISCTYGFSLKNRYSTGDKVAILTITCQTGVHIFSITFMGAVVVPILPDFHRPKSEMYSAIRNQELFVSSSQLSSWKDINLNILRRILDEDFHFLYRNKSLVYDPFDLARKNLLVAEDDLA